MSNIRNWVNSLCGRDHTASRKEKQNKTVVSLPVFLKSTFTWAWDGVLIVLFAFESLTLHFPALLCTAGEWLLQTIFFQVLLPASFKLGSTCGWDGKWEREKSPFFASFCLHIVISVAPTPAGKLLPLWSSSSQVDSDVEPVLTGQPLLLEFGNSISSLGLFSSRDCSGFLLMLIS